MKKRHFKNLIIWIGTPSFFLSVAIILAAPAIVINVLIIMVFVFIYIVFLIFVLRGTITQNKYRNDVSLYQWMDDLTDFDEGLTRSLKRYDVKYGTIDNLNNIKFMLIKLTKNSKSTLKMYRAFYKQQSKETGEELYQKTILVSVIPIGLFIFRDYFQIFNNIFLFVILYLTIIIFLVFISDKLRSNKKRTGILIEIIDLCIEEIEDEEIRIKEESA